MNLLRKIGPLLGTMILFVIVSAVVREHGGAFRALMHAAPGHGQLAYIILGILTVIIPFATLIPFIPAAVMLWGWQTVALLTFVSWVIGAQILFHFARTFGKPFVTKVVSARQMDLLQSLVQDKGFLHAVVIRLVFHGDIVSYAFGMFTTMSSVKYFFITAISLAPLALAYAYFGALPSVYQVGVGMLVLILIAGYWLRAKRRKDVRA